MIIAHRRRAGIEPRIVDVNPADPVTYVRSLNLHRRHLMRGQRAMVAARTREICDWQAKERQRLSEGAGKKGVVILPDLSHGTARDLAGLLRRGKCNDRSELSCPLKLVSGEIIKFRSGKDRKDDEEAIFGRTNRGVFASGGVG